MPEYLAPGVYVDETSFRATAIEGVPTSTAGFVGAARYGPVARPLLVTSLAEYERSFEPFGVEAQLHHADAGDSPNFLWHAARAFFEEGGGRLFVARVFKPRGPEGSQDGHARVDGERTGGVFIRARHAGAAGNLQVRLTLRCGKDVQVAEPHRVLGAPRATLRSVQEHDLVWVREQGSPTDAGAFFIAHWNEERAAWQLQGAGGAAPVEAGSLTAGAGRNASHAVRIVTLEVSLYSRDGSREVQTWSGLPIDPRHCSRGGADSVFEHFGDAPLSTVDASDSPIVFGRGEGIGDAFDVLKALGLALSRPARFQLEGGDDGLRPDAAAFEGEAAAGKGDALGLRQFEGIDDIAFVAAPGSTWRYADGYRDSADEITRLLIGHAERMRYRMAILDSADGQTIAGVRAMRAGIDSRHAALYYPWVTVLDPITGAKVELPPSGFVAGIYARSDIERGVHKAPANEVVRLAIGFETLLDKAQQEVLNPEGVNCFRYFEGRGFRLWGARTVSSDPEWKYVNVQRYVAYIQHSIDKATQWAVYEPDGERLWANVRRSIEDFLLNEWRRGALLGDKPEKAFLVRCDRSTMSQNDLDSGRLICLVGIAPSKPAEFVVFRIGQWTADRKA